MRPCRARHPLLYVLQFQILANALVRPGRRGRSHSGTHVQGRNCDSACRDNQSAIDDFCDRMPSQTCLVSKNPPDSAVTITEE